MLFVINDIQTTCFFNLARRITLIHSSIQLQEKTLFEPRGIYKFPQLNKLWCFKTEKKKTKKFQHRMELCHSVNRMFTERFGKVTEWYMYSCPFSHLHIQLPHRHFSVDLWAEFHPELCKLMHYHYFKYE